MTSTLRTDVFDLLKKAMRARRVSYRELARRLQLSEPTIKRLFIDRDCKLSRLVEICQALDLEFADLLERADRAQAVPEELPVETEEALGADPALFHLYVLLRDNISQKAIEERYELTDADMLRYGRDLEALGLAELLPGGRIRLKDRGAVRFRRGGSLEAQSLEISMRFLLDVARDTTNEAYRSASRRIRLETAEKIHSELKELIERFVEEARRDQLLFPENDLTTFKIVAAFDSIDFARLLVIPPRPGDRCLPHHP